MRGRELARRRLDFFVQSGQLARAPSPWQLRVGWLAGLPVYLSESERERRASRRTLLGQVPIRAPLQLLYNPRQSLLETGLGLSIRNIVRHLLCVHHEDAFLGYDLQLLQSSPPGLATLALEARAVVEGRNRWSRLLVQLVGGPGYHQRLWHWAERADRGHFPDPLDLDPRFATLVGFADFCNEMPDWPEPGFYAFERRGRRARATR